MILKGFRIQVPEYRRKARLFALYYVVLGGLGCVSGRFNMWCRAGRCAVLGGLIGLSVCFGAAVN